MSFVRFKSFEEKNGLPRIRVCVLGSAGVGKTAILVRYLTKRFIGEYCSGKDLLYKKTVQIDDVSAVLEIADTSSNSSEFSFPDVHVSWADACIVVYSIRNSSSFEAAVQIIETIQKLKEPLYIPLLLIANQKDFEHFRQVGAEDGQAVAVTNNCHFAELSAAEDVEGVRCTLTSLFREVRTLKLQRQAVRQPARPRLKNVSRLISSLIGRSSTSTEQQPCHSNDPPKSSAKETQRIAKES